jgi:hypothetical protein
MNKIFLNIALIISLSITFTSCTEEIELELNDSFVRLVVEGNITSDSATQNIILSKTSSYFSTQAKPMVGGAIISVTNGASTYDFEEIIGQPGIYKSKQAFAGKPGETYNLLIKNVDLDDDNGLKTYEAKEIMKSPLTIDSLYAIPINFFGNQGYRIFGFAQEPATLGDFYLWRYYINGQLATDTLYEITFNSDQLVNGNYLSNLELGFIFDGQAGDTLTLETNSITEDYFNYVISFFIETQWSGGGGFSGPPANIKTNINNGATGYFNTEARTRISIVLP